MPIRIILGLGLTVVGFAIAARRFHWLSRLIRAGQARPLPHAGPDHPQGRGRGRRGCRAAQAPPVDGAGARPLLHDVGLHHPVCSRSSRPTATSSTSTSTYRASAPWAWLGFVEDFFACAVLVALVTFSIIRLIQAPSRLERKSRFYGSHTGAAWLVLLMIAGVIITLLLYRGAQVNTNPTQFPYGNWAFASHAVASWLHPLGSGRQRRARHRLPHSQHRHHLGLHRLHRLLEAPAHLHGSHQRRLLPPSPRPGRPRQHPRHGHGERRRGHRVRRGRGRPLHLEADARLRHLYRVRTLPVASARPGTPTSRCRPSCSSWTCATTCSPWPARSSARKASRPRSSRTSSTPTCCGRARPAAPA